MMKQKDEAADQSLGSQISGSVEQKDSLTEKVAKIQQGAEAEKFKSSGNDLKPFMDEMWGED